MHIMYKLLVILQYLSIYRQIHPNILNYDLLSNVIFYRPKFPRSKAASLNELIEEEVNVWSAVKAVDSK